MHFLCKINSPAQRLLRPCEKIDKKKIHLIKNILPKQKNVEKPRVYDRPPKKKELSVFGQIREGWFILQKECALWKTEIVHNFTRNPFIVHTSKEFDLMWKFDGDPNSLYDWIITMDSDNKDGFSNASLDLTADGKGIFHGNLDNRVPKDGETVRSGYCNIRTAPLQKSFRRDTYLDWSPYNMLVMRIRGDGRAYMLNITYKTEVDLLDKDMYNYFVYTRGGPYWQTVQIPFSKFFISNCGRVQDKQRPLPACAVASFGITIADKINGPFKLEIDYIGVQNNVFHTEEFAYELYNIRGIYF